MATDGNGNEFEEWSPAGDKIQSQSKRVPNLGNDEDTDLPPGVSASEPASEARIKRDQATVGRQVSLAPLGAHL